MPGDIYTAAAPVRTAEFHHVSEIPALTEAQMVNKILFRKGHFAMLVDMVSGSFWATDCIWCMPKLPKNHRFPPEIVELFQGIDGVRLTEMSHNGRLRQLEEFFSEHWGNTVALEDDRSQTSTVMRVTHLQTQAMFGPRSFPRGMAGMANLPIGTMVQIEFEHDGWFQKTTRSGRYVIRAFEQRTTHTVYQLDLKFKAGFLQSIADVVWPSDYVHVTSDGLLPSEEVGVVIAKEVPASYAVKAADDAFMTLLAGFLVNCFVL